MSEAELLANLPSFVFGAMLVFARVGAAAMAMPGIGEIDVPARIRLGAAMAISALLVPVLGTTLPPPPDSVVETLRLFAVETVVGYWLGWLARLVSLAMAMAGQVIAMMLGISSALQPDALLGGGATATARLLSLAAGALVLGTGLYMLPLRAVAESYLALPPGTPFPAGPAAEAFAAAAADGFALAIRLAAPLVLAAGLFQIAMGLLARLAPQLQVYFVSVPVQVLGGIVLLALVLPALVATWHDAVLAAFGLLPGLR